jgi:hypothetical protein
MTNHQQSSPDSHTAESTSATTYGENQVALKGLPQPQAGGKKHHCHKCKKSHKKGHCGSKTMRKRRHSRSHSRSRSRSSKKGGFLQQALVPFGLFALQRRTNKKRSSKAHGKSHKKHRTSKSSKR